MSRGSARRRDGATTATIAVQAAAVGAVSANQFTGWNHSAGTVISRGGYGVISQYIIFPQGTVACQSKAVSRDQEVTFFATIGRVYLRMSDDGYALRFGTNINAGGGWSVDYVSVGSTGYESDQGLINLGTGTPSGLNTADTDGDLYVFGVEGFDVYVKWNGVEQWRSSQLFSIGPGRVGLRTESDSGAYGFRSVSVDFKLSASLYSSPAERVLEVRDFDINPLATTGSMTAASTTLTVASNPGFVIGDPIIVEIGGEAGVGARGTRGVGGQWPTLTYANATAMNADTGQVTNKVCALLDTGVTYQWNGSAWAVYQTEGFFDLMLPRALEATITNISGTTFTLDTAATVSTTSANVYLNAAVKYGEVLGYNYDAALAYLPDLTIDFPAGDFAWAFYNGYTGLGSNRIRWEVRGQGTTDTRIFSPKGLTSLFMKQETWTGPASVHDIHFASNCLATGGYHMEYNATTDVPLQGFPGNVVFNTSEGVTTYNLKVSDWNGGGLIHSYATDSHAYDCEITHATGHRAYTGWGFNFANSVNCTADRITIDFDKIACGFEQFQSTDCTFSNFTVRNAICAVNSSSSWVYDKLTMTIEEDCGADSYLNWQLTGSPIININSNIDNQQGNGTNSAPGLLDNLHFVQEGKVQVSGSGTFPWMNCIIAISGSTSDITIRGNHPTKPTTNGYIEVPAGYEPVIINDTEARVGGGLGKLRTVLDGIRVKGGTASPSVRVWDSSSTVSNCVLDDYDAAGTDTGNITNAAYDAL